MKKGCKGHKWKFLASLSFDSVVINKMYFCKRCNKRKLKTYFEKLDARL